MTAPLRCGIEYEYLLVDLADGRVRDFSNLAYADIAPWLEHKPGRDDPGLATGDLGIKRGYWYLEGDERFHPDGRFATLMVKGVEIRTPPLASVDQAVQHLLDTERQLSPILAGHGLGLAQLAFNPVQASYAFTPPLNPWEQALRRAHRGYDGAQISTLSYGPDINLSWPEASLADSLAIARKLNAYSPFILPFSCHSPFFVGKRWSGWSKRSFERARYRPAVKLFVDASQQAQRPEPSSLVHPVRLPGEHGRIEFKAFDAMPGRILLAACCHLLVGLSLARLPASHEQVELALYQRAALFGLDDPVIYAGAASVLTAAAQALRQHGQAEAAEALAPLFYLLEQRRTPAHALLARWQQGGRMYVPGGHAG